MLKLNMPSYFIADVIKICSEGITGNYSLRDRLGGNLKRCRTDESGYIKHAEKGDLYRIVPLPGPKTKNHIIIDGMYKSDFIKLYENYFRNQSKPGRAVYDSLMVASDEKCPYCGGIGRPRNLDHYLPKAHYPQFSILPVNLVPSCRDCNMDGKGEGYAKTEAEQVIQPYLDDDRYFDEPWLFARYKPDNNGEPGVIEYFVSPPDYWEDDQKKRVEKHFEEFDLALRFSKEAGPRLATLLSQYRGLLDLQIDAESSKGVIFQRTIDESPFVNHWERVMCLALMEAL
ncbi:endonuclease [Vibrio splendidus]|uniref:HNH endonuclease n=1 Tax=Vibrio splendidus TaxID=29497 RepID=UPI000D3D3FFF|nr:HNH endonuclease signature motif containing protein [Vibrio splendidus]PTO53912.1 endonuclease [Vibrio splendidus]